MQTKIDKKTLPQCKGCKIREKAELCDFASVVHNLKPAMFTPRGFMFEQVLVQPKLLEQIIQMPFLLWSQILFPWRHQCLATPVFHEAFFVLSTSILNI